MKRIGMWGVFCLTLLFSFSAQAQVSASPNPSTTGNFTLTWQNPQAINGVYEVLGNNNAPLVASVGGSSYQITGKPVGTYTYRIITEPHPTSCNPWVPCFPTIEGEVTVTVTNPPAPSTPGGFSVPGNSDNGNYTVSWNAVSGTVNSYQLQERSNGGSWSSVQNNTLLSRSFDKDPGGYYEYRVRACNSGGCSSFTSTRRVDVLALPASPGYVTVPANTTTGNYTVSWPQASGTVSNYQLQERLNSGSWSTVQNNSNRSRNFSKISAGNFQYRVRSCNAAGCSSYRNSGVINVPVASVDAGIQGAGSAALPINYTIDSFTLTWSSVMTSSCRRGSQTLSGTSGSIVTTEDNWNWDDQVGGYISAIVITCDALSGGTVSDTIYVSALQIPPPPTVNVSWNSSNGTVGQSRTLSWSTQDADSCTLDGNNVSVNGSQSFTYNTDGTFSKTVICTNDYGTTSDSASISIVYPAPTFASASISSTYGASNWGFTNIPYTLSWNTSNVDDCRYFDSAGGSLNVTNRPADSSASLHGSGLNWTQLNYAPYAYTAQLTLRCEGLNGSTINQVFNITADHQTAPTAPTVDASWDKALVARNEPADFSWSSTYANSCTLNGESVNNSGTRTASFATAGTQNWTVQCSNAQSSTSRSDSLVVDNRLYITDPNFPNATDPANDALDGGQYYGVLMGEHSVSKSGSFNYSIPVQMPPGINGVQPNISLNYSSDALNGVMGWGWNISGLSSISRCPATLAQDGYVSGINAGDNYKFCLDGQRLVNVGGNEYRTESESFQRITQNGNYWLVESPDGSKQYYGYDSSLNSVVDDTSSTPIKWMIDRQEDVSGNYFTFEYENDTGNASYRISEIAYTLNDSATGLNNFVKFYYEDRPDISEKYIANTFTRQDKRLSHIVTEANFSRVYAYHINYQQFDGVTYADPTQTSRVESVQLCYNNDSTCAEPVSFDWTSTASNEFVLDASDQEFVIEEDIPAAQYGGDINSLLIPESRSGLKALAEYGVRGDFDGDNEMEVAWMDCAEPATTENWDTQTCNRVVAMDKNAVGVVFEHTLARQVLYSESTNSAGTTSYAQSNGYLTGNVLDFNGDGLDDYYMHNSHGMVDLTVYISDGTNLARSDNYSRTMTELGNFEGTLSYNGASVETIWRYNIVIIDINGDKLPDLVRLPHWDSGNDWITLGDAGITDISVALNNGAGFDNFVQWGTSTEFISLTPEHSAHGFSFSDVNGDGLVDLVGVGQEVGLNTGSSFVDHPDWRPNTPLINDLYFFTDVATDSMFFSLGSPYQGSIPGAHPVQGYSTYGYTLNTYDFNITALVHKVADVNGDGLSDFVALRSDGVWVALSDGTGFLDAVLWTNEVTAYDITPLCNMMECNTQRRKWDLIDANKDGMADLVLTKAWYSAEVGKQDDSEINVYYSKGHVSNGRGFHDKHTVARVGIDGEADIGIEACPTGYERLGKPSIADDGEFVVHCQQSHSEVEARTNVGLPFDRTQDLAYKSGFTSHKILAVNESTSRSINIDYKKLRDPEVYQQEWNNGEVGLAQLSQWNANFGVHASEGLSSVATNSTFPAIFRGRDVVASVEIEELGNFKSQTAYNYFNQKISQNGFGSLGFEKIVKTKTLAAQSEKIRTVENYLQEIGSNNSYAISAPIKVAQCSITDVSINDCDTSDGASLLSEKQTNWKVRVYSNDSPRYFPYVLDEQILHFDVGSGTLLSTTRKRNYNDGVANSCSPFASNTAQNRSTSQIENFDSYGTLLESIETKCDVYGATSTRVENTNVQNDTLNWCLNKIEDPYIHRTIFDESTGHSSSQTNHTNYTFSACKVQNETREPDGNNDVWLHKTYSYGAYGSLDNLTEQVRTFINDGISYTSRSTSYVESFNSSGERILVTTNDLDHETTQVFDAKFGRVKSYTDANSIVTTNIYDDLGRLTSSERLGVTSSYYYRECSSCFSYNDTAAWYSQEKTEGTSATRTYFDALDRQVGSRKRGLTGTYSYTGVKYNALGKEEYITEPFEGPTVGANKETYKIYDVLGRVEEVQFPNGGIERIHYGVSNGVNAVTKTNTLDHSTVELFDANGRLKGIVDALGTNTLKQYDAAGNIRSIRVSDPSGGNTITYNFEFDELNRRTALIDPDIGRVDYTYNALGLLTEKVNAENERICFFYDSLDRKTQRRDGASSTCTGGYLQQWNYDRAGEKGLLSSVVGRDTINRVQSEEYFYTSGTLLPDKYVTTIDGEQFERSYFYDQFNRTIGIAYPTGFMIEKRYNSYGHYHQAVDLQNGEVLWQVNQADERGNKTDIQFGNGMSQISLFDESTGLLSVRVATIGVLDLQDQSYSFDTEGNLRNRTDNRVSVSQNFCYDPVNRLADQDINAACSDDSNGSYNGTTYAYDAHGNILRKDGINDYSYGQNGAGPHAVTFANGGSYQYDNTGRMTHSPGQRTIDYSLFGKPTYMGFNNGYQSEVIYGALTKRVERRDMESGQLTETIYVGKDYERVTKPNGIIEHRHYMGNWGIHVYSENNTVTEEYNVYLTRDHLDSVVSKSDDRANQTVYYQANEPWGRRQNEHWNAAIYNTVSGASLNDISFATTRGFTGHEHLDGVGLVHMNGRVYDTVIGRFVSPDPLIQDPSNTQSYNRYAYVWNNPLSAVDPSGYEMEHTYTTGYRSSPGVQPCKCQAGALLSAAIGQHFPSKPTNMKAQEFLQGHSAAQNQNASGDSKDVEESDGAGAEEGAGNEEEYDWENMSDQEIKEAIAAILDESNGAASAGTGNSGDFEPEEPDSKKKVRTSEPGDKVRTPESHPEDFVRTRGGGWKNKNTGEIWKKSHTAHTDKAGEWKVGLDKGKPPTSRNKITVGHDGKVIKIDIN